MAKDPAFLFYPGDWLGGTLGMTLAEKGAYMELLVLQFNSGRMTKSLITKTVGKLGEKVLHKFKMDQQGLYYNERLEIEKEKRENYSLSRRNNLSGKNQYTREEPEAGLKKRSYGRSHGGHMENINILSNNKVDNICSKFDQFWDAYDKKAGRSKAKKIWDKLKTADIEKILRHVPRYVASTPDKQFRKLPATYLHNESWLDEIIERNSPKSKIVIDQSENAKLFD